MGNPTYASFNEPFSNITRNGTRSLGMTLKRPVQPVSIGVPDAVIEREIGMNIESIV
jgi:hypothetical protein